MIISLQCKKPTAVLDLLVQAFDASLPVCNEAENVVGHCWIVERGAQLIYLETIEDGALEKWLATGRHVVITEFPHDLDEEVAEDNLLVVTATPGAYPCCTLVGSTAQELADLIEEAIQ